MPVHYSIWNQLHRGLLYAQIVTVGMHQRQGNISAHTWGPSGVRWLKRALKANKKNRSNEYGSYNVFSAKLDDLVAQGQIRFSSQGRGENLKEANRVKHFVRDYFQSAPTGVVSVVKNTDQSRKSGHTHIKRIEFLEPTLDEWVTIWEEADVT